MINGAPLGSSSADALKTAYEISACLVGSGDVYKRQDPSLVWRAFHGIDPVSFSPPVPGQVITLEKYRFPWDPKE